MRVSLLLQKRRNYEIVTPFVCVWISFSRFFLYVILGPFSTPIRIFRRLNARKKKIQTLARFWFSFQAKCLNILLYGNVEKIRECRKWKREFKIFCVVFPKESVKERVQLFEAHVCNWIQNCEKSSYLLLILNLIKQSYFCKVSVDFYRKYLWFYCKFQSARNSSLSLFIFFLISLIYLIFNHLTSHIEVKFEVSKNFCKMFRW